MYLCEICGLTKLQAFMKKLKLNWTKVEEKEKPEWTNWFIDIYFEAPG